MRRVHEMRGGKDYNSDFGKRMRGEGVSADVIRHRFEQAVRRLGMNTTSLHSIGANQQSM